MHKTYFTILTDGDGTSIDSCNLQKGQLLKEQNCDMFALVIIVNITKPFYSRIMIRTFCKKQTKLGKKMGKTKKMYIISTDLYEKTKEQRP